MGSFLDTPVLRETELRGIQRRRRIILTVLAVLLTLLHFLFLMSFFEPAISTPDANSYFSQAKLIAREGRTYIETESPLEYLGPHWKHATGNKYYCIHPPGLGAILSVVYRALGPQACLWVNPVMASLSLLGLFLLCRLWTGELWALLAAALMAVNPFANEHALFGDSHTSIIFFLVWALFFTALWANKQSALCAFGAGLFMGIIPTIRHPEVLYLPAIVLFVLFHFKKSRRFGLSVAAGVFGAAIGIGALCVRNHLAYGAFWKTGFSIVGEQMSLFDLKYLLRYGPRYVQKLMSEGCGLMFALGVTGIAGLCAARRMWKHGVLFAALVLPITVLYMSFFWGPDPQSMRYLLPTFYIYTMAGVWLVHLLSLNYRRSALAGSVVLLVITVWWGLPQSVRSMRTLEHWNGALARVTGELQDNVERGSVLIANEGINQHLDFIGYWRLVNTSLFRPRRPQMPQLADAGQSSLIAPTREFRNVEARKRYKGLEGKELFDAFAEDVRQWAGKHRKVYWVAKEGQIERYEERLGNGQRFVKIAEIELGAGLRRSPAVSGGPEMPPGGQAMSPLQSGGGPEHVPAGPMGPNHVFDLVLDGKPLIVVEWKGLG
jgi:hypothetical protein